MFHRKCKECGKPLPRVTNECTNCGAQARQIRIQLNLARWIAYLIALIVIIMIVMTLMQEETVEPPSPLVDDIPDEMSAVEE